MHIDGILLMVKFVQTAEWRAFRAKNAADQRALARARDALRLLWEIDDPATRGGWRDYAAVLARNDDSIRAFNRVQEVIAAL